MNNCQRESYAQAYNNLIENSTAYNLTLHKKNCEICKLPKEIQKIINKAIFQGEPQSTIILMIKETTGKNYNGKAIEVEINKHAKYMPLLLENIGIKGVFKKAKYILENNEKDIVNMNAIEKANVIEEIELQLIKDYSELEGDRLTALNQLFKETLPLMLSRLNNEIVQGTTKNIKDLTSSSNTLWQLITTLNLSPEETIQLNDETEETHDTGDTRTNILSLADKITKATNKHNVR